MRLGVRERRGALHVHLDHARQVQGLLLLPHQADVRELLVAALRGLHNQDHADEWVFMFEVLAQVQDELEQVGAIALSVGEIFGVVLTLGGEGGG